MNLSAESELTTLAAPVILYDYVWFNGHPVGQVNGGTQWTFTDHLGTPLIQTDTLANVFWRAEHEPYGRVFTLRTANQHQPLRRPGQESEELNVSGDGNGASERFYNIFRWYRSAWGRYTQSDPAWRPYSTRENLFSYSAENPARYTDPFGLACAECCRPPQIAEDKERMRREIGRELYRFLGGSRLAVFTKCEDFAAVVETAIARAKPRCHDWAEACSQEQTAAVIFVGSPAPAHTATALRPCDKQRWEDGFIWDAWPGGILGEYSWSNWNPGIRRYTPTLCDPGGARLAKCPFRP
jgi:RHS repeat-associated protein